MRPSFCQEYHHLRPADVHDCLAVAYEHADEIEAGLAADDEANVQRQRSHGDYRSRTSRRPVSIRARSCDETRCTRSIRNDLSIVMVWEAFATESLESPVADLESRTLPGASARLMFVVRATAMIVRIRLLLNASAWTTRNGRRQPG